MTSFVSADVSDFFDGVNGHPKYIRDYVDANPGPYPVYSASLAAPFGLIDTFDFEGTFLTWVMNGYGGRVQVMTGRFSANRDRGVFVPKPDVRIPDLTYLKYALEPQLTAMAVGRTVDGRKNEYTKIYPGTAVTAQVLLPVDSEGGIDYSAMESIGERMRRIDERQDAVRETRAQLAKAVFAVRCREPFVRLSLGDTSLFSLSIGERVLRAQHVAEGIPVYSANVRSPFGSVTHSNLTNFEQPSLLWGIDGIFDWNLIPAGQAFATTDHCGRLQIKSPDLDPEYVLHWLRSTRAVPGFDRVFRASLSKIRSTVDILVPVTAGGRFDVDRQREAAEAYRQSEVARDTALEALDAVLEARLNLMSA